MKSSLYPNLQKKIITLTLIVACTPLIILGIVIYKQFCAVYSDKIEEQITYRAKTQALAIELVLDKHTAILCAMADSLDYEQLIQPGQLAKVFEILRKNAQGFIDIGLIDASGIHNAYIGPYRLQGLDYSSQPWFSKVMSKGVYISNIFMGYRQSPHFIIAVKRQQGNKAWILRSTIDSEIFNKIVSQAQIGKTGDAFIIDTQGILQSSSRFKGNILDLTKINSNLFSKQQNIIRYYDKQGQEILQVGIWLKNYDWLFIVSQQANEEREGLFTTRNTEIIIIILGIIAILLVTFFTTKIMIKHLQEHEIRIARLNSQLIQSDKLAALGKMAAGIAHEINNPLAVIQQNTGWIADLLEDEDIQSSESYQEFVEALSKVDEHVNRAQTVVHNMLGYARKMEPVLESVDVNDVLERTIALLQNYSNQHQIEIKKDFDPFLQKTVSNQAQLQQVFLNLISNAIDVVPSGGIIMLSSSKNDDNILVQVQDNGPGIPEEKQHKVFDPFFTTKEIGKGTGLGLWVCYNIMEKLGGNIRLKSEGGQGTVFIVTIPIIKNDD